MKIGFLLLLFIGLAMLGSNQAVKVTQAPPRIEYRYLPRDLDTYWRTTAPSPYELYEPLFTDEDISVSTRP